MAALSPAGALPAGLGTTRTLGSAAASRSRISTVPSLDPPSATTTSIEPGYSWSRAERTASPTDSASSRTGITTATEGHEPSINPTVPSSTVPAMPAGLQISPRWFSPCGRAVSPPGLRSSHGGGSWVGVSSGSPPRWRVCSAPGPPPPEEGSPPSSGRSSPGSPSCSPPAPNLPRCCSPPPPVCWSRRRRWRGMPCSRISGAVCLGGGHRRDAPRPLVPGRSRGCPAGRCGPWLWPPCAAVVLDGVLLLVRGAWPAGGSVIAWAFVVAAIATVILMAAVLGALRQPSYTGVMAATGLSYLAVITSLAATVLGRSLLPV